MNEQLEKLIRLQEIDRKRELYRETRDRLPQQIDLAQGALQRAKQIQQQFQADQERLGKERKEKERDLQVAEEKLSKLKTRLTELKTNKEYQAHLSEMEVAKADISRIEEELLLLMDHADTAKKKESEEAAKVSEEEKRFTAEKVRLEERLSELEREVEGLIEEEAELLKRLDPKLLQEYRQLIKTRKGLAVVALEKTTCSGCHFSLPPQLVTEVKKMEKILTCSYCHRILYLAKG